MARKLPDQKNAENLRHCPKLAHSLPSDPHHQEVLGLGGGGTKATKKRDQVTKASAFKKLK